MESKEKIKAFIEENATYKVGQAVYWISAYMIYGDKVASASIDSASCEFCYFNKAGEPLGGDADLYGSWQDALQAISAQITKKLYKLVMDLEGVSATIGKE